MEKFKYSYFQLTFGQEEAYLQPEKTYARLKQCGYDAIEICPPKGRYGLGVKMEDYLKIHQQVKADYGLEVSNINECWGEMWDPYSPIYKTLTEPKTADLAVSETRSSTDFAAELGAPFVTVAVAIHGPITQDNVADLLSNSGCVDPADITQPYSGLIPYDINVPFWSDGADKYRYIGVLDGETIAIDASDDWVFPPGTVLVKDFRLNGQLIETRHLMRHPDGVWAGYTYEWNQAQTEATRVRGGKVVNIGGQDARERAYRNARSLNLHTDRCDYLGMLCLR